LLALPVNRSTHTIRGFPCQTRRRLRPINLDPNAENVSQKHDMTFGVRLRLAKAGLRRDRFWRFALGPTFKRVVAFPEWLASLCRKGSRSNLARTEPYWRDLWALESGNLSITRSCLGAYIGTEKLALAMLFL
jgi:hypothetical protein